MNNKKLKVFICATEQSGDNIGHNSILEILKDNINIQFDGVGGSKMAPYLTNHYYSLKDFKSLGILEIIFSIRKYLNMISFLIKKIFSNEYDIIITIDSPDFNYPLVKKLRNQNYNKKIIHIVAPTVWAWRGYRAKNFSKVFDELLVLFDFEVKYFDKYGLKTTFVGHPIFYIKRENFINYQKNIAFLFGSRMNEVTKLLPYFSFAYDYLLKNFPKTNIFIPTLPHLKKTIENSVKEWKIKPLIVTDLNQIENIYLNIDRALVCSGTASLEISKRNIPQLVIYKLNFLTEIIIKLFTNIRFANILNIISNTKIIPEIVNSNLNKDIFITQFENLMINNEANYNQIQNAKKVMKKLETNSPPYSIISERIISYF